MNVDISPPAGIARIPTTTIKAKHTTLTELVNGRVLKRLVIVEPSTNLKRGLHRHLRRDDYIYVLSGQATLTIYDGKTYAKISMRPRGDVVIVPKGLWHGYETGSERTIMIEASTEAFDPMDSEEFHGEEPV